MNGDLKSWDEGALDYLSATSKNTDPFKKIIDTPSFISFLGDINNKKILDVGCGDGLFCKDLAKSRSIVYGLDVSKKMIDIAKKNSPECEFILCDLIEEEIPAEKEFFDIVTSKMMLMNLKSVKTVSEKIFKVLKKTGFYAVDIVHPCYPFIKNLFKDAKSRYQEDLNYFDEVSGEVDFNGKKFKYYYRPLNKYINEILECGFTLVKIQEPRATEKFAKEYPNHSFRTKYPTSIHMLFKK